ncbi:hypothetical protein PTKIN_Ptkin03bG0002300 [Pterospermum kingtungense]
MIDVSKPLKQGKMVSIIGRSQKFISFKYERLLHFCYICGCLDHQDQDCEVAIVMIKDKMKVTCEFGPWLRAESFDFSLHRNIKKGPRLSYSQSKSHSSVDISGRISMNYSSNCRKSVNYRSIGGTGDQSPPVQKRKGVNVKDVIADDGLSFSS